MGGTSGIDLVWWIPVEFWEANLRQNENVQEFQIAQMLSVLEKYSVLEIETPIDALFVPRICPNGKPAHVSWVYCPWGGEKLEQETDDSTVEFLAGSKCSSRSS